MAIEEIVEEVGMFEVESPEVALPESLEREIVIVFWVTLLPCSIEGTLPVFVIGRAFLFVSQNLVCFVDENEFGLCIFSFFLLHLLRFKIGYKFEGLISLDIKSKAFQSMKYFMYKTSNKDEKGA